MASRLALAALVVFALLTASGCPEEIKGGIAASGPKKYKADIMSSISNINGEMDAGEVSDGAIKKLEGNLKKWEKEMGGKGTYMMAKQGLEFLKKGKADPNTAFQNNQEARMKFQMALDYFKTEVPD